MNIPDDKVTNYPKDNAIVIHDPRVFKGVLIAAKTWGSTSLNEPSAADTETFDEHLIEFAEKIADLRAKYEVSGDMLNGETAVDAPYHDELNALLAQYRGLLFDDSLDYVSDDTAIDLIEDVLGK